MTSRPETAATKISVVYVDDQQPSPEQALTRKRKVDRVGDEQRVSQKGKKIVDELTDPAADRSLRAVCGIPASILDTRLISTLMLLRKR